MTSDRTYNPASEKPSRARPTSAARPLQADAMDLSGAHTIPPPVDLQRFEQAAARQNGNRHGSVRSVRGVTTARLRTVPLSGERRTAASTSTAADRSHQAAARGGPVREHAGPARVV